MLPSFDHGVGDPVPDGIQVIPQNKIILVEGNYLLLGERTNLQRASWRLRICSKRVRPLSSR